MNEETEKRPTFDASRTTLIDQFMCFDCKYELMYARTLNDECITTCPKCQSRAIYLKRLSGRIDDDPVKPSIRTKVHSAMNDLLNDCSVEELVALLSDEDLDEIDHHIDGEQWKFGEDPSFLNEGYDFFSEDGHDERTAPI